MSGTERRTTGAWLLASALVVVLGAALIIVYLQSQPQDAALPKQEFALGADEVPDPRPADVDLPDGHLVIPSLQVSAPLDTGGVVDGLLQLPTDVSQATLWDGSAPLRSRTGSVLAAGHLDNAEREQGALHRLADIEAGAEVYLVRNEVVTRWKVTGLRAIHKAELPAELWKGKRGARTLYVVTCGGRIVKDARGYGHYEDNIVVTAVPLPLEGDIRVSA